jgi:DNA replication protein DnaC
MNHSENASEAPVVVSSRGRFAMAALPKDTAACELCQGRGERLVELDGVFRVARCRCQKVPDRISLYNKARIPARHAKASFESFDKDLPDAMPGFLAAYRWVKAFQVGQPNRGLVLHGAVGRGKTHLLAAMLRELVFQHGVQVRFVEFTHLLAALKQGFEHGQGQGSTLDPLADVEILAIDELGKGRNTEWELAVVDELISRRYNGMKTLLATTNYAPGVETGAQANLSIEGVQQSLGDRIGDRTFSRLMEMVDFQWVQGEDFRGG